MEHRLTKLAQYVRGWMGYFGISQYYRPIPELDEWLRRRVRMCYWKQWRLCRTKVGNLLNSESVCFSDHHGCQQQKRLALSKDVRNATRDVECMAEGTRPDRHTGVLDESAGLYLKVKRVRPVVEPPGARPARRVVWGLEVRDLRLPD